MATSVTGVGSEHMTLGVSHLIGPRWNEEKEKQWSALLSRVEDYGSRLACVEIKNGDCERRLKQQVEELSEQRQVLEAVQIDHLKNVNHKYTLYIMLILSAALNFWALVGGGLAILYVFKYWM